MIVRKWRHLLGNILLLLMLDWLGNLWGTLMHLLLSFRVMLTLETVLCRYLIVKVHKRVRSYSSLMHPVLLTNSIILLCQNASYTTVRGTVLPYYTWPYYWQAMRRQSFKNQLYYPVLQLLFKRFDNLMYIAKRSINSSPYMLLILLTPRWIPVPRLFQENNSIQKYNCLNTVPEIIIIRCLDTIISSIAFLVSRVIILVLSVMKL